MPYHLPPFLRGANGSKSPFLSGSQTSSNSSYRSFFVIPSRLQAGTGCPLLLPREEVSQLMMLQQLIQDFLRLSRLESGLARWQIEPLSLPECLDLAISNLKTRRLPETLPQIVLYLPNFLPPVQADGEGLTEVLIKLLDNACKFTPTSDTVNVSAQVLDTLQMLEVIIIDTGRGIDPSQLESIFDRFYQEEAFLQRTIGGSGLGLAICRQIIQSLGGKIWATSAGKDKGSQFHLTIPISTIVL